ncbi:two-component system LytT family sensor kinase [Cellulosimicrobium cellulans]|uniref:Sensor histidine kinase n=1 Tax=Cellulosimicrobium cellulans TaxID=1710 RepID=A0A1Y0HSY5_CELCE|nr:histidine kinase [Cellulosimicrobium cellulans]ARU51282.1 sensor histidine kinase [Cellulosimicrobium cellulans]MBM7817686.1 two-component system LytT family sensor kinase [Cellulosimicrobium cellulans]
MSGPVFAGAVAGLVVGVLLTLGLVLAWRLARGSRELGSDSDRATFRTLHLASRAATHLRGGLDGDDVGRAARSLRQLLGADALAVVTAEGAVALDGSTTLEPDARRVAERVLATGRRHVESRDHRNGDEAGGDVADAVGAPVVAGGRVAGVVVAFAGTVRPPLVRATGEVAQWCSAQLELGELEASRTALAQAELRALRAQISPHFVYNALGAIASFISTDPERARDLVLDFADFTRYSFRGRGDFTTLADELGSIHSYVELERARFGERLAVTLQIAPESLTTVIPFLSVQPLVENAVRHGLEPQERGGTIVITARDEGTQTEITVEDDGVGMDPAVVRELLTSRGSEHVGLRNVDRRVRQLYGDDHALDIETAPGSGTLVRLRVPRSQPLHETEVSVP